MSVTLLLPGALLPREVVHALAAPLAASGLAAVLARARIAGDGEAEVPAHLGWLGEHLFGREGLPATAPYAWAALAGAPPDAGAVTWHADPVHLELARDHLVLTPLAAPLATEEAEALLAAANELAAGAGLAFARLDTRWFVRAPRAWALAAPPLAAALGRPLQDVLPAGADAGAWNRLLTELQMTWHAHPVNAAREARGERTANSVWLHGGGLWEPLARPPYARVLADEPEWRGAAAAAGIGAAPAGSPAGDGALLVRSELLAPRQLHDWGAWLDALRGLDAELGSLAAAAAVDLVLTGDATVRRLRTHPADRLKFWRHRALTETLTE